MSIPLAVAFLAVVFVATAEVAAPLRTWLRRAQLHPRQGGDPCRG